MGIDQAGRDAAAAQVDPLAAIAQGQQFVAADGQNAPVADGYGRGLHLRLVHGVEATVGQ